MSSSTSIPSRTPSPLSEIGTTWAIATAGMNATTAATGRDAEGQDRKPTVSTTDTWYTIAVPSTPTTARRVGPEAADAHVHRADEPHPVLVAP